MQTLFTKHLFITNVASCGGLLALGDCIVQNFERAHAKRREEPVRPYDFERTGKLVNVLLF